MATVATPASSAGKGIARFYRPELDVLRFAAFAMVFLSHVAGKYALADTGTLGVPIFFLLSSFLITELLQREKRSTGTVHISSFYMRRILRIWPLYFAALLFGFLFVLPVAGRYHLSVTELLYYLFFMGNWWTAFHGYLPGGLGPLWSITVEEQFYLFWPWIVRRIGRRGILSLSIGMWFMSQIAILGIYHVTKPPFILVWTNTLDNLQYFALGAGLSAFLNGRIPSFRPATRIALGLASLGIFAACGPLLFAHSPVSGIHAMVGLSLAGAGATAVFLSLYGAGLPGFAVPLTGLGRISYGLYVMHGWVWLITGGVLAVISRPHDASYLLRVGLTISILFPMAMLSYQYFEKPFLNLKSQFQFVKSGLSG